jgi:glycine/D-amino acid oxidase-like deaminating enzyme
VAALEEEVAAMHTVGLAVDWAAPDSVPLPFLIQRAARLPRQARFHPLCYLQGLARQLVRGDNPVFEQTHVLGVDTSQGCTVQCEGGRVFADAVVLATHTPIGLWPVVQTKVEPMRSYIIGIRTETPLANALFWDMEEPYHYLRLAEDEQGPLMIVGGEDHKTGESAADPEAAFQRLEAYSRSRFGPIQVDYRWSAQLYDPADGLPYIGASHAEPSVYFATGYTGEGLTGGTYAARILADAILGQPNPWADLYDPNRVKPVAGAAGLWSENIGTLKHFVGDRIRQAEGASIEAVAPGEGMLVDENGQKVAVYREADGSVHRLSPVCTHAGCLVHWNPAEASWDCPCHGGRYDAKGKVLNGPPTRCLEALDAQGNPQGGVLTAGAHHENP